MKSFLFVLLFSSIMCTPKPEAKKPLSEDATALNKQIVKRVFDELINQRNIAAIDELYMPTAVDHSAWEGQSAGSEGLKEAVKGFIATFPDLKVTIEDMTASEDIVATRETWQGTYTKSNKVVTGETMHFFKIQNGKVTDEWSQGWDWLPE